MLKWPPKDPDEVLDFDVDWTRRLMSADELAQADNGEDVEPADEIVTSQFTLPAGVLVASNSSYSATATKVWLTGGAIGEVYEILNRVTTAGGRTMDQTVSLKIKAK